MKKYTPINGWTKEKIKQQLLLKNNGTRSADGPTCLYITEDNNRCAVGCFIPDSLIECFRGVELAAHDLYDEGEVDKHTGMQTSEWLTLMDSLPLKKRALKELQSVHDSSGKYYKGNKLDKSSLTNPNLCSENVHVRMLAWVDQFVEDTNE